MKNDLNQAKEKISAVKKETATSRGKLSSIDASLFRAIWNLNYTAKNKACFAGNNYFAKLLDVDVQEIEESLKKLEQYNLIKVYPPKGLVDGKIHIGGMCIIENK